MDKLILGMVHDSAKDLHAADAMKEMTLREFDALCLPPVKHFRVFRYLGSQNSIELCKLLFLKR
jgi:hypothetical protein